MRRKLREIHGRATKYAAHAWAEFMVEKGEGGWMKADVTIGNVLSSQLDGRALVESQVRYSTSYSWPHHRRLSGRMMIGYTPRLVMLLGPGPK
jgi:hypothetical protein